MFTHWIVVANAARAQVFGSDVMLEELEPVMSLVHPASRMKNQDLITSRPGSEPSAGHGVRSAFDRHTEPREVEVEAFARQLAEHFRLGRTTHAFERLILLSPPAFLGHLRAELDKETAACIVASAPVDLTQVPGHELADRIRRSLPETAGLPAH